MTILERAHELLNNSFALRKNPDEKRFWEDSTSRMSDPELTELISILETEQKNYLAVKAAELENKIVLNDQHLQELQVLLHRRLPLAKQRSEQNQRIQENPDAILSQL